jgi:hypothetical protein
MSGLTCQECFNAEATMYFETVEVCDDCYHNKSNLIPYSNFVTPPDFLYGVTPGDIIYDIETFPNAFTIGLMHTVTKRKWYFEISIRRNDIQQFCQFIDIMGEQQCRMVGYNNIGFDYPVIHFIHRNAQAGISVTEIYDKAMSIIGAHGPARFAHMVWESEWLVQQLDLYKIHHFDNMAKATSLKVLEFNMRMDSIEDLPFPVGTVLTVEQIQVLADYMWHDIDATMMFYDRTAPQIKLREDLSIKFNTNMTNMNNGKIGETALVQALESKGVMCYEYQGNKKVKRQTKRESIDLAQVIFPYVQFENLAFQQIKVYLESKVITETKGVFKGLTADIDGLSYHFGTGGLHASVESQVVHTTDTHQLVDVDVKSFYPKLAIKNKIFPAHLSEVFCDTLDNIYHTRTTYDKGTSENEAYKEALNVPYGNSNNEFSVFFDSFYTMSITINGQLLLCMLVEQLLKTPGLRMIQANTDGVTYLCPYEHLEHTRTICRWWEQLTNLELEEALYSRMFIRDVNSYIAEKTDGKLKRIGAYAHVTAEENPGTRELPYHKDWSARVVALAAEAALVHGTDIREFITNHADEFDFFLRTKVPRSSTLEWGGQKVSNIVRYYISTEGKPLEKVMPPKGQAGEYKRANKLTDSYFNEVMTEIGYGVWDERIHTKNKSTYGERRSGINTGYNVMLCNNLDDVLVQPDGGSPMFNINHEWYIAQAEKLVKPLLQGSM